MNLKTASKPLFRDPIHDGAADPVVIYNRQKQVWWMFYTNRRANVIGEPGVRWVHGTHLGIAESSDKGLTWNYVGFADIPTGYAECSHWAPEIIFVDNTYHMYLSVVPGMHNDWGGTREITHFTSPDLVKWTKQSILQLSSNRVIDACVAQLSNKQWRMWYNDEVDGKSIHYADSSDLYTWTNKGLCMKDSAGEGPKVFQFQNHWWMIVDHWDGQGVYRSNDANQWELQPTRILQKLGTGLDDKDTGRHADVVVSNGKAFCFYFTHPHQTENVGHIYAGRRSSIHATELKISNNWITTNRDDSCEIEL